MIVKEREEEEGVEQGERSRGPAIHRGSDACPRIAAIHSLPWGTLCVSVSISWQLQILYLYLAKQKILKHFRNCA